MASTASITSPTRRVLIGAGLAAAVVAAPVIAAVGATAHGPATPLAACPPNEVLDIASGACKPVTDVAPKTMNPIEPGNTALQPGGLTSSRPGDVGRLPEVNGIPCTGQNTGLCIGLTEQNNSMPKVTP